MAESIARAFLAARPTASWPASGRLTTKPHANLPPVFFDKVASDWKEGKQCDYAAAMIAARQKVRSNSKWADDPFYWAPFILIGPPRDVTSATASQ